MTGPRIDPPSFFNALFGLAQQQQQPPPQKPSQVDGLFQSLAGLNAAIRGAMVPKMLSQLEGGAKKVGEDYGNSLVANKVDLKKAVSAAPENQAEREKFIRNFAGIGSIAGLPSRTVESHVAALRSIGEHTHAENLEQFMAKSKIRQPVFHGTAGDFTAFDPKKIGTGSGTPEEGAFFFSTDPKTASHYAEVQGADYSLFEGSKWAAEGKKHQGAVMPVYLKAENPYVSKLKVYNSKDVAAEIQKAKKLGHDSITFPGITYDGENGQIAVFKPEQIKSATGNTGQFDPKNASILASLLAIAAGLRGEQK